MAMKKWGGLALLAAGVGGGAYAYSTYVSTAPQKVYAVADKGVQDQIMAAWATLNASDSKSLLKKHFTKSVAEKLKARKTELGATLMDVIQSGVKNLDSGCGVYAPDAESYETFKELFDPIIEEYHGFGPKQKQPPVDLGESKLGQLPELDKEGKYIISTRIRCGRSLKGYPFNPCLSESDYLEMERKVKTAFDTMGDKDKELAGSYYPLDGMSKSVQKGLIADHFLFKEGDRFLQAANACRYWPKGRGIYHNKNKTFLVWVNEEDHMRIISMQKGGDAANACRYWPKGRGIYHNKNKTFLVWVNEEDHMRIISMQKGGDVGGILDRLIRAIKAIEGKIPFSRDDRLGYLTFCPTNLGTTVRASVHIKLPNVSSQKDFKDICEIMNLQVRGIHGEHSESEGGIYDVSNKQRMGFTEFQAVKQMYDGVKTLIEMEKEAEKKK